MYKLLDEKTNTPKTDFLYKSGHFVNTSMPSLAALLSLLFP
jgi:hypothetical protein